ncbi:MAG: TIGR03618 family F420-dependent PPOX class oxidoreductase [Hamadaea sp.]|nr:TIGR03618 family F420-dependent PPOX class oxidoreductase [Hamadaea sp.]NUT02665.1 TIGR03618 family F420-dependent PPOX class oxidoreductase [Hamadaea sp.]
MSGAPPIPLTEKEAARLIGGQRFGILASVKRDGHPHLSTVLYRWSGADRTIRVSSTADRLKVRQLRRDPRTALHVSGPTIWSYAVAEGEAEVSEPSTEPGDAVGRELLAMTPGFTDHAAEQEFLEQLVADRRVVIRIRVARLYGAALTIATP